MVVLGVLKQSQARERAAGLWFSSGQALRDVSCTRRRPWEQGLPRGLSGTDGASGLHATGARPAHGSLFWMPYAVCCRGESGRVRVDPEPDAMEGPVRDRGCDGLRHVPSYIISKMHWRGQLPMCLGTAVAVRTRHKERAMLLPPQQTRPVCHCGTSVHDVGALAGIREQVKHLLTVAAVPTLGTWIGSAAPPWMPVHAREPDLETATPMKLRNSKPARAVRLRTGVGKFRASLAEYGLARCLYFGPSLNRP